MKYGAGETKALSFISWRNGWLHTIPSAQFTFPTSHMTRKKGEFGTNIPLQL